MSFHWRQRKIRRALDIISIEMRLSPSLSRSACTTVLARTPACGSSHCATFSTCKWQCHQTLSFHQSIQGGHEYTKGERGGSATSRSFAWPNYKALLSLSLSVPCFPRALFVFILKGMVTFSRRLKQGRSGMVALVKRDCKCKYKLDSQCHLSFSSQFLRLGHRSGTIRKSAHTLAVSPLRIEYGVQLYTRANNLACTPLVHPPQHRNNPTATPLLARSPSFSLPLVQLSAPSVCISILSDPRLPSDECVCVGN